MNVLISKQAAIEAVHKDYDAILDFKSDGRTVADSFEDIINALPPAHPQKGKWVRTYRDGFGNLTGHCNKCGGRCLVDNFCPNCGADMREGDAE